MNPKKLLFWMVGIALVGGVVVYLANTAFYPVSAVKKDVQEGDTVVSLESEYQNIQTKLKETEAKLAQQKINTFETELDLLAKFNKPEYLAQVEVKKAELKRLNEKLDQKWTDKYRVPEDLFYTFLKTDGAYVTQTPREHFSRNGFLATDVATHGEAIPVYAPDYLNEEREYEITYEDFKETTGKAVVLTSGNIKWLLGHVVVQSEQATTKTGDRIGVVGCTEGVTTGCHVHIELYLRPDENSKWQIAEYQVGDSNKHEVIQDRTKPQAKANPIVPVAEAAEATVKKGKKVFATAYNPVVGQTDGTPCVGASGVDLCEETKKGARVIALSQDLVGRSGKKYAYGDKITVKSDLDDPRCNGEFVVLDTMNKRFSGRADLFFMNKGDNVSCNLEIL